MMSVPCLLMDATNSGTSTNTNVQVINISSSCAYYNASQLHCYWTHDHEQQSRESFLVTAKAEKLCGRYENHQGMYICSYHVTL